MTHFRAQDRLPSITMHSRPFQFQHFYRTLRPIVLPAHNQIAAQERMPGKFKNGRAPAGRHKLRAPQSRHRRLVVARHGAEASSEPTRKCRVRSKQIPFLAPQARGPRHVRFSRGGVEVRAQLLPSARALFACWGENPVWLDGTNRSGARTLKS